MFSLNLIRCASASFIHQSYSTRAIKSNTVGADYNMVLEQMSIFRILFFSLTEYTFRTNMLYKGLTIYKAELLMRFVVVHSTVIDEINMAFG